MIVLALALLAALAFFLPYFLSLYSGDDIPPEGLGRPLASMLQLLNTLEIVT